MPLARFRFSPSQLPRALHVFPPAYWKDERDFRPLRRREGRSQGENRSRDTGESGRKQGNAEENSEKQEDNKEFNKKRGANNVIDSKIDIHYKRGYMKYFQSIPLFCC